MNETQPTSSGSEQENTNPVIEEIWYAIRDMNNAIKYLELKLEELKEPARG